MVKLCGWTGSTEKWKPWMFSLTSWRMQPRFQFVIIKNLVTWISTFAWCFNGNPNGQRMGVERLNPNSMTFLELFVERLLALCWSILLQTTYLSVSFDINNACLQVLSSEKHHVVCDPEFWLENVGKHAIIVRVLFSSKSSGADYSRHVHSVM